MVCLQLFLNTGVTFAEIQSLGNCLQLIDWLKIIVNGSDSWNAPSFNSRPGIPSGPLAFEVSILLNSLCTSSLDIVRCSTQSLLLWADSSSFSKFMSAGFSLTKGPILNVIAHAWISAPPPPHHYTCTPTFPPSQGAPRPMTLKHTPWEYRIEKGGSIWLKLLDTCISNTQRAPHSLLQTLKILTLVRIIQF